MIDRANRTSRKRRDSWVRDAAGAGVSGCDRGRRRRQGATMRPRRRTKGGNHLGCADHRDLLEDILRITVEGHRVTGRAIFALSAIIHQAATWAGRGGSISNDSRFMPRRGERTGTDGEAERIFRSRRRVPAAQGICRGPSTGQSRPLGMMGRSIHTGRGRRAAPVRGSEKPPADTNARKRGMTPDHQDAARVCLVFVSKTIP